MTKERRVQLPYEFVEQISQEMEQWLLLEMQFPMYGDSKRGSSVRGALALIVIRIPSAFCWNTMFLTANMGAPVVSE